MLGKIFSRQHLNIFIIFPRALRFHANCLLRWQFAWNLKDFSSGKKKQNINLLSAEFGYAYLLFFPENMLWHFMLIVLIVV